MCPFLFSKCAAMCACLSNLFDVSLTLAVLGPSLISDKVAVMLQLHDIGICWNVCAQLSLSQSVFSVQVRCGT